MDYSKSIYPQSTGGKMKKITIREALRDAMLEEMERSKEVFLIGEEVAEYNGAYKVSQGLLDKFGPDRVIDTPITEHGFAGLGVGSAFSGLRPIVEFMTFNFAMQAIDQIINSAAKTSYMSGGTIKCPIVFRGPNGSAQQVSSQHSQDFTSWYAHCPGLKVIAPYDAVKAKALLKSAIRDNNPVIFLENENLYGKSFEVNESDITSESTLPIGKAFIEKTGTDITIIAYSIMVGKAIESAEILKKDGVNAEVIDLCSIRPLDVKTIIQSVKKTGFVVTVEEGWRFANVGSEIASTIMENAFDWLDGPVTRVCAKDVPLPYTKNLESLALPQTDDIVHTCKDLLGILK